MPDRPGQEPLAGRSRPRPARWQLEGRGGGVGAVRGRRGHRRHTTGRPERMWAPGSRLGPWQSRVPFRGNKTDFRKERQREAITGRLWTSGGSKIARKGHFQTGDIWAYFRPQGGNLGRGWLTEKSEKVRGWDKFLEHVGGVGIKDKWWWREVAGKEWKWGQANLGEVPMTQFTIYDVSSSSKYLLGHTHICKVSHVLKERVM